MIHQKEKSPRDVMLKWKQIKRPNPHVSLLRTQSAENRVDYIKERLLAFVDEKDLSNAPARHVAKERLVSFTFVKKLNNLNKLKTQVLFCVKQRKRVQLHEAVTINR